jgi:8-oxo-dGTP pyrophosphatase MutT (NUDIX family)
MIEKLIPEPGAMLRTAARDRDFGFHITASWADVQRKAKRIRSEGGVTIVIASNDGIGGQVKGDHGTYEALLVYRPGTHKVADWTCGCKWAAYAFERSPGFQRFEGRKCSHALALQFEAQSQGMFGKEVHPAEPISRERPIVRYDPDANEHVFARPYEGSLIGTLVARLRAADADPAEVIGDLVRAGVRHRTAVLLWKDAEHHEDGERRCPHCGGFIGVEAIEHHHCPHCGAPLGGEGHHHEGSVDDLSGPAHAAWHTIEHLPTEKYSGDRIHPDAVQRIYAHHNIVLHPEHDGFPDEKAPGTPEHVWPTEELHTTQNWLTKSSLQHHIENPDPQTWIVNHNGQKWIGEGHHRQVAQRMIFGHEAKNPFTGAKAEEPPGPKVSGIALKAHDTGRVLMLQRGLDDEKDPAAGTWEFPGGHHEDGDRTSLHAGIREFEEEVGQEFPLHGAVKHTWTSPDGIYQGHVVVIPSEKDLSMKDGRVVPNPDDPKGDCHEQAAWWAIDHARKNPALRAEVKAHTPWKHIETAHSNTTNPASTGWAAGEDPDNWANLDANPEPLTPSLGFDAVLHDHPEPALPVAYGDEDHEHSLGWIPPGSQRPAEMTQADLDPVPDNPPQPAHLVPDQDANIHLLDGGSSLPNSYHASVEGDRVAAVVEAFQKSTVGQQLVAEASGGGGGDEDIVAAAQAHLAKQGAKQFGFAEQQELITEGATDGRRARNLGSLQIKGTHYELLDAALNGDGADPTDLFL